MDATRATVLLHANFAVTGTQEDFGGPGGRGGPQGSGDAIANS
ncbi:hypothetical protein R5O87_17940 [Arthrobacter globiformis]